MAKRKRGGRGLVIVYTGDGKGKTTAALGTALRAVGRGFRVLIIQFIKGSWEYGELESLKRLAPELELVRVGKGFVGIVDDTLPREEHEEAAREGFDLARKRVTSGEYDLVILDELNYAVQGGLISIEDVMALVKDKPPELHLLITGRDAHPDLIAAADLVTEMREVKHPYQKGIPAMRGIDM